MVLPSVVWKHCPFAAAAFGHSLSGLAQSVLPSAVCQHWAVGQVVLPSGQVASAFQTATM